MTAERIALGVSLLACVALVGWNVRLQSQLADLSVQVAQESDAPVRTASTEADRDVRVARSEGTARDGGPPHRPRGAGHQQWVETGADDRKPGEREKDHQPVERDWDAIRAEMETITIDTIEAYATQNSWDAPLTEEILAIYLDSGEAVGEIWAQMHDGETTHYRARKEMHEIRAASGEELIELIGEESHEAMEEHLWEARRDIWRRAHDRDSKE